MNTKQYECKVDVRLAGTSAEYCTMEVLSEGKRIAIHTGTRQYIEKLKKTRYSR